MALDLKAFEAAAGGAAGKPKTAMAAKSKARKPAGKAKARAEAGAKLEQAGAFLPRGGRARVKPERGDFVDPSTPGLSFSNPKGGLSKGGDTLADAPQARVTDVVGVGRKRPAMVKQPADAKPRRSGLSPVQIAPRYRKRAHIGGEGMPGAKNHRAASSEAAASRQTAGQARRRPRVVTRIISSLMLELVAAAK
jgi:hypothetical protein